MCLSLQEREEEMKEEMRKLKEREKQRWYKEHGNETPPRRRDRSRSRSWTPPYYRYWLSIVIPWAGGVVAFGCHVCGQWNVYSVKRCVFVTFLLFVLVNVVRVLKNKLTLGQTIISCICMWCFLGIFSSVVKWIVLSARNLKGKTLTLCNACGVYWPSFCLSVLINSFASCKISETPCKKLH